MATQVIQGALVGNALTIDDLTGQIDSYNLAIDLLLADQATFYTASVGVSVSGALVTNSPAFYASTVTATYGISAALYANAGAFYAATVAPGSVTIAGTLVEGSTAFYGAVIAASAGSKFVSGALAANDNEFFGATVSETTVAAQPGIRMYSGGGGGSVYRVRDEDVQDLMRLLFPARKARKKRKRPTPETFEQAAMALLFGMPGPTPEPSRQVVIDYAGEIARIARARNNRAELQSAIEAMLQMAADAAEAQRQEDDEDVLLLLLAA